MELKGQFVKVVDVKKGVTNDRNWAVATFLVRNGDRVFCFEWFDENCEDIKNAKIGGEVTLDFKIQCREYNGKYFTSLRVNYINYEKVENTQTESKEIDDGLPF